MKDKIYIDGLDVFIKYGISVEEDGYKDLIAFPPLKSVTHNDWHEEDGIEPDLSDPVLNIKEFTVPFIFSGTQGRFEAFIEQLSDMAYHEFYFKEIERSYKLRLVSQSKIEIFPDLKKATLQFADDCPPVRNKTQLPPQSSIPTYDDYELNGTKLTDYGIRVLAGSLEEIEKSPAVKPNMLRNITSQSGAIYDGGSPVTFKSKDVKINCLMRAASLTELWRNYDAFLQELIKPGLLNLYVNRTGYEYPCYYKNCSVSKFYATDKIWLEFSLTLVFTSFRVTPDEYILATENGDWIILEDNISAIDLQETLRIKNNTLKTSISWQL